MRVCRSIEDLCKQINIDALKSYYRNHTRNETEEVFNLTASEFGRLAKKFDLFNFKRECKRFSSIQELRNLSKKDFASLKLKYTNKDLMEKFGVSKTSLYSLIKKFDLLGASNIDLLQIVIDDKELKTFYLNNTFTNTCKHFNLNNNQLHKLLSIFGIPERSKEDDYAVRKATFLSNYGKNENPAGYRDFQDRYKKTMFEKYGAENPA